MQGIHLPICSFVFAAMLCIVYFSKKRINLLENKIYSVMLIVALIDSSIVSYLLATGYYLNEIIIEILNKIDFAMVIIFNSGLFLYTFIVTIGEKKQKLLKNMFIISTIFSLVAIIIMSLTSIDIQIESRDQMTVTGPSAMIVYLSAAIHILFAIIISLFNFRSLNKKHIPIFAYTILITFALIIYAINPYIIIVSITITFINYLMFFIIENPDMKMLKALNIAESQADSDLSAKNEWLKQMRHEINTPAGQALFFTDEIKNIANSTNNSEILEYANYVDVSLRDIVAINSNAIILASLQTKGYELTEGIYKTEALIERINQIVKYNYSREKENVKFKLKLDKKLPKFLVGDLENVERVILIYLSNAFKYTDKGTVELNIKSEIIDNKCFLTIIVKDTGRGIQKEDMKKLFKEFERIEFNQTQGNIRGIGLGLSIAKQVVDLMNGSVKAESIYGKGSTFTAIIKQSLPKGEV